MLMQSDPSAALRRSSGDVLSLSKGQGSGHRLESPVNIGSSEYVTVDELEETVIEVAGKESRKKYVEGPVGVQARNPSTGPWYCVPGTKCSRHRFSKERIRSLGWEAKVSLKEGIALTYPWIEAQVEKLRI